MNLKVGLLTDVISEVGASVWLRVGETTQAVRKVKRLRGDDFVDVILEGERRKVLAELEDQRVRLDMNTWEMEVEDITGRRLTIGFGACVAA